MTDETNLNDGNWHRWIGGDCPVDLECEVEAVWHDEDQLETGIRRGRAGGCAWATQILKFRVIKGHREPREWWAVGTHMCATKDEAEKRL